MIGNVSTKRSWRIVPIGAWVAIMVGCSSTPEPKVGKIPDTMNQFRSINSAYHAATLALRRPPANSAELLAYLKKVGDGSTTLRSERDGEEIVIVWGTDPTKASVSGVPPVWAYEKRGADGTRYLNYAAYTIEVAEADFEKKAFPPGHKPK